MLAVKGSEEALSNFNDMKLGKKTAYIIFRIKGSDIITDSKKTKKECKDKNYLQEFIDDVKKPGQPRFAVVDWNGKLLFVSWVPSTGKASLKMKYASSKEQFVQELVGVHAKLQATDDGELSIKEIENKTKSNV